MAKKTKFTTVHFECPCKKELSLFKILEVTEGTPPEEALIECPSCDLSFKIKLENQLVRDKYTYRSIKP